VFAINDIDAAQDKYEFVPSAPATPVVLGPANPGGLAAQCIIDFTVKVLKVPTKDARADAGVQTNELGGANATSADAQTGQGTGTNFTTVDKATIGIQTQVAPAAIVLGATFHDTATLTPPAAGPPPTGTVTFSVYGDAACAGPVLFTSTNALNAAGTTATSVNFTPTAAGTYHVVASYSGDANYDALTSLCADPAEALVVTSPVVTPPPPPPPAVVTPPPPPPVTPKNCTTPPGPAPAGGKLCPKGTAAISGKTGCQGAPFNVVVSGHQIKRVVFTLDGKVVKTLTRPNSGTRYKLPIRPSKLKRGTHRVVARTIFTTKSGTKSRTLRVTFSRCAHSAVAPAFTG
jgi:hypothetical protein